MPGSLRLDDDPFASFLDHDPFEAALQSTEKDYNWVLNSPRGRRAEAKYGDDDQDAPRFTHVRIAEEKARTRSVAIGTDQRMNQIVASTPRRDISATAWPRPTHRLISHRHRPPEGGAQGRVREIRGKAGRAQKRSGRGPRR